MALSLELPLYDFKDYRDFLKARLTQWSGSRGQVSLLAKQLRCQSSFLSQVISRRAHLSREHGYSTARYFAFSAEEQRYFMLMIEENRATTPGLRAFYLEQLEEILERRQEVREHINVKQQIGDRDKYAYYTAWWYVAIHIVVALPGFQTPEEIARRLRLSLPLVQSALDFLCGAHLVNKRKGKYSIGAKRIHLDKSSPMLAKHHVNWRLKAIQAIENANAEDLSYSAVIGISEAHAKKLKTMLLDLVKESEAVVQESSVEDAFVFSLDFFRLR